MSASRQGQVVGVTCGACVIDIDGENPEADLHADLNSPKSLPAAFFDCVILTQVLQFLSPEEALGNVWASVAPGGAPAHRPVAGSPGSA
jgi:hypothetical protein